MTFNPTHDKYINFNTASFAEENSSIGANAVLMAHSNMEWMHHFQNTQVISNIQVGQPMKSADFDNVDYRVTIKGDTDFNQHVLLKSFGPFKISTGQDGKPQPLQVAIVPALGTVIGQTVSGTFTVALRTEGQKEGSFFPGQTANLVGFPAKLGAVSPVGNYYNETTWYSLTSSARFGVTSSIIWTTYAQTKTFTPVTQSTAYTSATSDALHSSDLNAICLAYLDVYFKLTTCSPADAWCSAGIKGLWKREYCPKEIT